jgi:hypothetical protein
MEDSNGQLVYSWTDTDKQDKIKPLCFPIFKIDTNSVQHINSLILNEAHDVREIVYRSKSSLLLKLNFFLSRQSDEFYGLKTFSVKDNRKVAQLIRLEIIAHSLGSNLKAEYKLHKKMPPHKQMLLLVSMDGRAQMNFKKSRLSATASGP